MICPHRRPAWPGLLVGCLASAALAIAPTPAETRPATQPASQPASQPGPTSRPERRNIFFPNRIVGKPTYRPDLTLRPFKVVGLEQGDGPGRVLLRLRNPTEIRWIDPGNYIQSVRLLKVESEGAVFEAAGVTVRLAMGQSSGRLLLGKRRFTAHCTIIGIVGSSQGNLALVSFAGQVDSVHLAPGDVLPIGRIDAIGEDSITVDSNGFREIVKIGQRTDSRLRPRTSE